MAINFPNSPSVGQVFIVDNKTYRYNGVVWEGTLESVDVDPNLYRANDWLTYEALKFTVQNNGAVVYTAPSVINFSGAAVTIDNVGSEINVSIAGGDFDSNDVATYTNAVSVAYSNDWATLNAILSSSATQFTATKYLSNVLPVSNATFSLGSETYAWKDIHIANGNIYAGAASILFKENQVILPAESLAGTIGILDNFRHVVVSGQPTLEASTNANIQVVAGEGITLTTNTTVSSLKIATVPGQPSVLMLMGA